MLRSSRFQENKRLNKNKKSALSFPGPAAGYILIIFGDTTHCMNRRSLTRLLLIFSGILFLTTSINAQVISVTIQAFNQKKEPLAAASVSVKGRNDSSIHITHLADNNGTAVFNLKEGMYNVRITSINYQVIEKGIVVTPNTREFRFEASPLPKTLKEVVVTSQKPLMRQEDDKTIVDAENLAASSTSGYEVIEKTPGLFVDQDGNIYISSLSPATVQINGRDMKMSASDVATILKSLPPNAISRIEIIRTPSAKYDASGSGGVVNVVLRKGVKIGMTGSVNAGVQQGTYGNQFIGFNLNNNDGKKSSFVNFNYNKRNSYEKIITDRYFAPDSMLSQAAFTKYPSDVYYAGFGITNSLGKKWEIDYSGSLSLNDFNNSTENRSVITKISTEQLITSNLNKVRNDGSSLNIRNGVELLYKIDTLDSEWETDLFHNYTRNEAEQVFATYFDDPFRSITGGDGTSNNTRNLITLKSDLVLKMKKRFTFESGFKTSLVLFRSETNYFRDVQGVREKDNRRTNTFHYDENINALYLQGSKTMGKNIILKVGTRLENTNMEGKQLIPSDTTFKIHRTDLFPYVYLSKNIMKIAGYDLRAYLVYRRTINRPVYEQLNPFVRFIDQYLSETGNPSLRPQFTQNFEANISVDERPILAVGVNDTKDIFTNVIYQADSSQSQAYRTYDNLGKNREWYFRGLGAIPPGGRYFFVVGAQYNHNFYQGLYENKPLAFKKGTWTMFTYQTFKLDKKSMLTFNGFYRLKGQQQFYELSSFGAFYASINRRFMQDKLVLTLSLSDIFSTNKNDFTINQGSVKASGYRLSDTRRIGINLRYNFGIRKREENNDMLNAEPAFN